METNNLRKINELGQSVWLDFIDRSLITSERLARLIEDDRVTGVTSNPAIFEKAITSSSDYEQELLNALKSTQDSEKVFYRLAISDIQNAADLLRGVYHRKGCKGDDGYVSLEVSPFFAMDTDRTVAQALELWKEVDRENAMIKIPGTKPGLAAIRHCIAHGVNINVTLLFSVDRYREVAEAYISGLEDHLAAGHSIGHIASVASFFLSRIDVLVDPLLEAQGNTDIVGQTAIASAKIAYDIYKKTFIGERWEKLAAQGARPQRLLWASTGTKNPKYKDTKYVEALIGPQTVNTIPVATMNAFRDHGIAGNTLETGIEEAYATFEALAKLGISLSDITQELEEDGIHKFNEPFEKLLKIIDDKKGSLIVIKDDDSSPAK